MVRFLSSLWPIDHKPELLQLAIGFLEATSKKDLLPADASVLSLALGSCPGAILPGRGGQRARYVHQVACASGDLFIHPGVFAFEHGWHLLDPADVLLRGDLQEKL